MAISVEPIGTVQSTRTEPIDDNWDKEQSVLVLDPNVLGTSATQGIEEFSHIEVLFVFDRVLRSKVQYDARRPRGNPAWPEIGILAQRGKNRPNRIGATICEVIAVESLRITVKGLDAIDGTPIIDVKPVMKEFLPRSEVVQPGWTTEIMAEYW
ncbi:MAG: SAM-dependent methyltransferase [Pseudomonadota bacterium]